MTNVVFDFGGVLFRWRPATLLQQVLPHHAHDEFRARELAAQVFGHHWSEFDRGTVSIDELATRIANGSPLTPGEVRQVVDAVPRELTVQADTAALIERLHAEGHALFFLSNMPEPYVAHVSAPPVFARFRGGIFSARDKIVKPEQAIYQLHDQRFGTQPGNTVFIDDMPANVAAANAHGWHAIQFETAAQVDHDIRAWMAERAAA
jgi:putative hydrolase of the HAD superfamily